MRLGRKVIINVIVILLNGLAIEVNAQSVETKPYLQDASPNSIKILWETSSGTESTIQYGTTNSLGSTQSGSSITGSGSSQIHTVELINLLPNTKYYYRAKTGNYQSNIHEFVTPPALGTDKTFRIVAFSDMQSHTWHYKPIVEDGIIEFSNKELTGNLSDDYGLVLVPGDLVGEGYHYPQWSDHFFNPGEKLYSEVPIYPVIGNHDIWELGGNDNSNIDPKTRIVHYKKYFDLPLNGSSSDYEEWYYKDYGNVRIIALNSEYNDNQQQLNWLQQVLDDTKNLDHIDFVFTQMHHPNLSELYNSNKKFSQDALTKLENFTTESGKPGIQFFGHTHGYSKGQSRDHSVVIMNVGNGGGRLDNWDENWPRKDYEEFSVSLDEYGFSIIEVTAGDNPTFELKMYGMGDENQITAYQLRDQVKVKKINQAPAPPMPISPVGTSNSTTLKASNFYDPDGDEFGNAHFQLSTSPTFNNLIVDDWKQFENWYMDVNTQANDDLTDITVSGLNLGTTYYWRVRYRDKALAWSDWSETATFTYSNVVSNDPKANFIASSTIIYEGETIAFTDISTNNPTNWNWTFEGGTPTSSTIQNPNIQYNKAGTYKVSLEVSNSFGTDSKTIENYITVIKQSAAGDTIAFYTFEGNTNDVSGNDRHATGTNISFISDNERAQVGSFNGNSYADIYSGSNAAAGLPVKEITIAAWVKASEFDSWGGFIGLFQDNGADEDGWVLGAVDQKFSIAMTTSGNAMTYLLDDQNYNLGEWYYVAATYNGTLLNLYVNGELKGTSTVQSGNISYPSSGWHTIGRYKDDNEDDGYNGLLDNVLILKKALSESEIENSFTSGIITKLNQVQKSPVTISPNPFTSRIKIISPERVLGIEIYNQLGEVCYSTTIMQSASTIDLSVLPDGVYMSKVTTINGAVYTNRIIKQ